MVTFSQKLQRLLGDKQPKTLGELTDSFAEKGFAVLLLILLSVPALPLPTGGITHIFEIIAMLLALELIAGRQTVWLPHSWLSKTIPASLQSSALPRFIKIIKWVEKYSQPRLRNVQSNGFFIRVMGLFILVFTLFAFVAPPFSALDTMPAIGVVLLSLAIILEDALLGIIGIIVGSVGVGLILWLGKLVLQLI